MTKKLSKDAVEKWLDTLGEEYNIVAPVKVNTTVFFSSYSHEKEISLDGFSTLSPKNALFPPTETLVNYHFERNSDDSGEKSLKIEPAVSSQKVLIFGARPCDVRGISILDRIYAREGDYQDPYYKGKRDWSTIVAIVCKNPANTCFCTSVGGGPADGGGTDILLTEIEEAYLVEPLTERGEALINNSTFKKASPADKKRADEIKKKASKEMKVAFSTENLAEKLVDIFSSSYWQRVAAKCLSCGACTYVCPTCHCFNITDEGLGLEGKRIRTWDSCMFPLFTVEASGHNPRAQKFERLRNRINHKFSYFVQRYGTIACVGCGRCIRACPVSLDVREIIQEAWEVENV